MLGMVNKSIKYQEAKDPFNSIIISVKRNVLLESYQAASVKHITCVDPLYCMLQAITVHDKLEKLQKDRPNETKGNLHPNSNFIRLKYEYNKILLFTVVIFKQNPLFYLLFHTNLQFILKCTSLAQSIWRDELTRILGFLKVFH